MDGRVPNRLAMNCVSQNRDSSTSWTQIMSLFDDLGEVLSFAAEQNHCGATAPEALCLTHR
jgi:hypothetical protein